ncbi:MAG: hypothetical protein AAFR41_03535 [Pseudomonadota bacterium]
MPDIRIEAEDFSVIEGYSLDRLGPASGKFAIGLLNGASTGIAETTFSGQSGVYEIAVGHFDEKSSDGIVKVFVNGTEIGEIEFDRRGIGSKEIQNTVLVVFRSKMAT